MRKDEEHLKWCLKQRNGVKLTQPSNNLEKAYREKARNAIKSMDVNAREGITEWAVSTSYYAKYFTVYALLSKIGFKCEIHDCTITLFEYLFHNTLPPHIIDELRKSRGYRVDTQYYTRKVTVDLDKLMKETKTFVLEIEKIMDNLNTEQIKQLLDIIKKLVK